VGAQLPAISGRQLMKLLRRDGWTQHRSSRHGIVYYKQFPSGKRVTIIPNVSKSLPPGTLSDILGQRQTGLGRAGLVRLVKKYGL